ncbi:MAG: LPS export ABC transporter ATP-binding protein [Candidatus Eisenbacteria bacterium]|nr:LPS export ABC transporter ATP-binding protein [Candidatus Eisenbacteria bacterium]
MSGTSRSTPTSRHTSEPPRESSLRKSEAAHDAAPGPSLAGQRVLEQGPRSLAARGLVKRYGRRTVVDEVDLDLGRGEVVGLLGPNGAGKTTSFHMIVGLLSPDGGAVLLDGRDVTSLPMYRRARLGVGYLSQESSIFRGLTVGQNIMSILETIEPDRRERRRRMEQLLGELDIGALRDRSSDTLSGGERRRVEITRALVARPAFLLLDEPFVGIDPIVVQDIQAIIRRLRDRGIGILITDHSVRETLSVTDRAYIMYEGRILLSGKADELAANEEAKKLYLGERFRL